MEMLRDVKFEEIYDILDKIKEAHKKEDKNLNFNQTVEKLATFLPNIAFRHFIELKMILREHDYLKFDNFRKNNDYIEFDRSGTSEEHFPWWEVMIDMEDATLQTLKETNNMAQYGPMYFAKELLPLFDLKIQPAYLMHRQLFLKKYGKQFPTFSARLNRAEAGLKELEPKFNVFLSKVIYYCYHQKSTKLLELVLNRIDYLLEDKNLTHPSNVQYLSKIKKLSNN
jgi:hypothetical protein